MQHVGCVSLEPFLNFPDLLPCAGNVHSVYREGQVLTGAYW
jgi:hypothetical protein